MTAESSDPWDRLLDICPALFAVTDPEGHLISGRGAWREILGWDPEQLVGQHFDAYVHPDDLERVTQRYDRLFAGEHPAQIEVRNRHADGSYRWIAWTAPVPVEGQAFAVGIDITEQRARDQELEQARAQLDSVLETLPFYLTRTDTAGVIEDINRTYPGVTREQVIGTHLLNWLPPDHREPMREAIARVVAGEPMVEFVGQGSGADGPAWYRSRLGPVVRDGRVVGVTIVGEDVTQAKRAEQRAVQDSRLQAIGHVAGAIAHDFNNALSVMLTEVDMLDMQLPSASSDVRQSFGQLQRAIEHAAGMTRDLVHAVRHDTTQSERIELVASLEQLRPMLQLAAGNAIELRIEARGGPYHVALAAHELQRCLVNLVVNAREAIGGSGHIAVSLELLEVTVGSEAWLDPGRYVKLSVRDDGPGIDAALRERVLEPCFTTKPQGGGFGLSSCLALARARGGDLWLGETPGPGAEVFVALPLLAASGDRADDAAEVHDAAEANREIPGSVLLAEDDERLRFNVARYLRKIGITVLEACDGQDALEVLERHPGGVDLVVTDLSMPRLDGIALLSELRRRNPQLSAIVVSGHAGEAARARAAELGVPLLAKPIAPRQLLEAMRAAMGQ